MRIAHLGDLHLGKVVNNYSMIEDQRYMLEQVMDRILKKEADMVVIAGDVYDRPQPSAEAVTLLNDFVTELSRAGIDVFIIAGNHDSGERLEFASDLLSDMRVHIAGTWKGKLACTDLSDRYGILHVWQLPYLRPSMVNRYIEDESKKVSTYNDAVKYAVSTAQINPIERNILIAHQFVTGTPVDPDGSEEINVGGMDNVDASAFAPFDYTALGHIHEAQSAGSDIIRYCGTPLKYSFSEAKKDRSFTMVNLEEKGIYRISLITIRPLHEMETIEGTFKEITQTDFVKEHSDNYVKIVLKDEEDIPDAVSILRSMYPRLMQMDYDNARTRTDDTVLPEAQVQKDPSELFEEFYESRNNVPMSEEQREYIRNLMEEIQKEGQE
ncbi:MAG: exonuclease SbcCD subunit D [Bulleidia sp.]|nr:exonuclease SbcCD subunit D [Bulleidia sp.]